MTAANVLMYVPRSAACRKKFCHESFGLGERFRNVVRRAYKML